jgi:DNA (cytosine-5)-methyltransferase 1
MECFDGSAAQNKNQIAGKETIPIFRTIARRGQKDSFFQMTYKLIDLFCGAGGMSLGFVDARFGGGFESVLAVDNDRAAVATHHANFGVNVVCRNIEDWLDGNPRIPKADVVIGGPPCQGFSLLNKKRIEDHRRALWEPYLDVVERCGADLFVMENVSELYRSRELAQIQRRAQLIGYETRAAILNAADFGTPQTRKRTLVIGWRATVVPEPTFPPRQTHAAPNQITALPLWRTVREAISDLGKPAGTAIGAKPPLDLHFGRNPTAKSLARYKAVPKGGNRFDLQKNARHLTPACWIKKTSGGTDLFGRLWWDRPSVTIRTEFFKPEKGRYLHPSEHRPITHREAARLMGFPDDFTFKGTKTEIAKQIGNAVPPDLAAAIAGTVKEALDAVYCTKTKSKRIGAEAGIGATVST